MVAILYNGHTNKSLFGMDRYGLVFSLSNRISLAHSIINFEEKDNIPGLSY